MIAAGVRAVGTTAAVGALVLMLVAAPRFLAGPTLIALAWSWAVQGVESLCGGRR
jgi:hypothetical protein